MASEEEQDSIAVRKVYPYGTTTSIPDFDVCRLSFYLKCCVMGCNMIPYALDERVADFERAHLYSIADQMMILKLAVSDFSLHNLLDKAIFLDEERRLLPAHVSNAFFEFGIARHYFPIKPPWQQVESFSQVSEPKVMLCTMNWINDIYIQPIFSLQKALINLPTTCLQISATRHCIHCLGIQSQCTCDFGCHTLTQSCCRAYHRGIQCSECRAGFIHGSRYRCTMCKNCNLCRVCYEVGDHDQMHAFERIVIPLAASELLPARALSVTWSDDQTSGQELIPVAEAVPIESAVLCDFECVATSE